MSNRRWLPLLFVATSVAGEGCDSTIVDDNSRRCEALALPPDTTAGLGIANAGWPSVVWVDEQFELYFTGTEGAIGPTFRSTSADGVQWSAPEEVLAAPFTTVITDESGYHAWFARPGGIGSATPPSIGYASSTNGTEWRVSPTGLFDVAAADHPNNARIEQIRRLAAWKIGPTFHVVFEASGTEIIEEDQGAYLASIGHLSGTDPSNLRLVGWPAVHFDCIGDPGPDSIRLRFSVTKPCSSCPGSLGVLLQRQGCNPGVTDPMGDLEFMTVGEDGPSFVPYAAEIGSSGTLLLAPDGTALAIEVAPDDGSLRSVPREAPQGVSECPSDGA